MERFRLSAFTSAIAFAALTVAYGQTTQTAPATATGQTTEPPRVHFLATGGTISNRTGGRLTAEDLTRSMAGLERYARVTYEQFSNVASSQLTLDQWVQLSKRISQVFASDSGLAGIVVTSGTDTLEETAFFLHLTVRDPRPVVVVGAMRNASTLGYEGAANLLEGVRVAATPAARGQGVLVVLNDEINSARDVTKTDALRLQTFRSREAGLLGVVDSDRVVFYRQVTQRHTARSEFDITSISTLPRVDVLLTYQGAPGDLIKAAVDAGARGIVVATAGAGSMSGTQSEGVRYAAEKGVFVVSTTRAGNGRVAPSTPTPERLAEMSPAARLQQGFSVSGEDHLPVKARVLLMLALTKTTDRAEIQRMFSEY
jgi:L-asparaginase